MLKVNLKHNKGFKWFTAGSVWVKGYLFDEGGRLYSEQNLTEYFASVTDELSFRQRIAEANGSFAVVIDKPELGLAAVDRLRSIPLFYSSSPKGLWISDDVHWLRDQTDDSVLTELSKAEFMRTGYVLGADTLLPSVKQLQAGEYISFKADTLRSNFYYRHLHGAPLELSEEAHFERLEALSNKVFERLICSAEGRSLVIPLSGGYDSRYIAVMLKRLGYDKVICYTYGRQESSEVDISRQVAEALGYPWHFVEYTPQLWEKHATSKHLHAYYTYAHNFASLPHVQDYPALVALMKQNVFPENAVIVPGFCGDLLGGSYVPAELSVSGGEQSLLSEGIEHYIYRRHFNLKNDIPAATLTPIKEHILQTLANSEPQTIAEFVSLNEAWFTEHKVAKFIVNALRPYEFFGYSWRMPLWDNELSEYWYQVPLSEKGKNGLYDRYLLERVFAPYHVAFPKYQPSLKAGFISELKKRLPQSWRSPLQNLYWRSIRKKPGRDINATTELADFFYKELELAGKSARVSNVLAQPFTLWLLQQLEASLAE